MAVVVAAPQAAVTDLHRLGPVLGVDDRDAAVSDHQVIDIGLSASRPAPVMHNPPPLIGEWLQRRGGQWLGQGRSLVVELAGVGAAKRAGQIALLGGGVLDLARRRGTGYVEQSLHGGRAATVIGPSGARRRAHRHQRPRSAS